MTAPLDLARSELRLLITKAARGAGLSWGLAEEAGWAADWLARARMPAAEWAADWLAAACAGRPDPVTAGVALADAAAGCDRGFTGGPVPEGLTAPGYLLPFLHRIAIRHGAVDLSDGVGHAATVLPDGAVRFGPVWAPVAIGWRLHPAQIPVPTTRVQTPASVVECLEGLALRTTVPASATSRRDAGSALSDND